MLLRKLFLTLQLTRGVARGGGGSGVPVTPPPPPPGRGWGGPGGPPPPPPPPLVGLLLSKQPTIFRWRKRHDNRELKNHDEVHDDDVCLLGQDWNENVSFGGKKDT